MNFATISHGQAAKAAKVENGQTAKAGTIITRFVGDKLMLATTIAGRGVLNLAGGVLTHTASATDGRTSSNIHSLTKPGTL